MPQFRFFCADWVMKACAPASERVTHPHREAPHIHLVFKPFVLLGEILLKYRLLFERPGSIPPPFAMFIVPSVFANFQNIADTMPHHQNKCNVSKSNTFAYIYTVYNTYKCSQPVGLTVMLCYLLSAVIFNCTEGNCLERSKESVCPRIESWKFTP